MSTDSLYFVRPAVMLCSCLAQWMLLRYPPEEETKRTMHRCKSDACYSGAHILIATYYKHFLTVSMPFTNVWNDRGS